MAADDARQKTRECVTGGGSAFRVTGRYRSVPVAAADPKQKAPAVYLRGLFLFKRLAMTYFRAAARPHYHWRRAVSLPSSEWDRVVPARYYRQANRYR
jgi:hypothetical protein